MAIKKTVTKRQVATLLRSAAKKIEVGGLAKKAYRSGQSYCALGAIGWDNSFRDNKVVRAAFFALKIANGLTSIPAWNDHPLTTQKEVVSAFRKTARLLEHGMKIPVNVY